MASRRRLSTTEPEEGKEALEGKDGANKYSYWVCSEVGGEWTRLPHVAASHVCAARKLRRFLTGDLEAPVPGHPPFHGREKHLVRATIARITAGTVLAPTGLFEPEEGAWRLRSAPPRRGSAL